MLLRLVICLALGLGTLAGPWAPAAEGKEPPSVDGRTGGATDRLWDWRTSKEPSRVLGSLYGRETPPGGMLVCVEPTTLASSFFINLAAHPVPDVMAPTGLWLVGRGATPLATTARGELAAALAKVRTVPGVPTQPMLEMLRDAVKHAGKTLPEPRHVLLVTTRFDPLREGLEDLVREARAVNTSISIVCPEAPFADNAQLLMKAQRLAGEAPAEEVPFDWDLNICGLWLAPVRYSNQQSYLVPDDVKLDPWRLLPRVRGVGYGYVPSGFTAWPISRVTHATGGRVFLHSYTAPAKASCTFQMDPALYRRLAPSVADRDAYHAWRRKDRIAKLYDRALTVLTTSPGVLIRDPRRKRKGGEVKGVKPLPVYFTSDGDITDGLKLAARKEALVKKALTVLGRIDNATGAPTEAHRFHAHCVLLMTWLHRAQFHLRQYELTLKDLRAEDRLASGVTVAIGPRLLWKFCYGIRGAGQRNLGPRPGPDVEDLQEAVVDSSTRLARRYRNTPWEAAAKLGFLLSYRPYYQDGRERGPAPAPKSDDRKDPVTPRDSPKPKDDPGATTPSESEPEEVTPPTRPAVGGGGTGGAVTGG